MTRTSFYSLVTAIVALLGSFSFGTPPAKQVWFDDLVGSAAREDDLPELAEWIWAVVKGNRVDEPSNIFDDEPAIVLLSLSDGKSSAHVALGTGANLKEAVTEAIRKSPEKLRDATVWMKLDIVHEVTRIDERWKQRSLRLERSLHGLAWSADVNVAFLPEEFKPSETILNSEQAIHSPQRDSICI